MSYELAIRVSELRGFQGWRDGARRLPDEAIVYLRDDLTVVEHPFAVAPLFDERSEA